MRHMEMALSQIRKHHSAVCQECFQALRITELLWFDLLILDYFLGAARLTHIASYVDACVQTKTNFITDHVRSVHNQIAWSLAGMTHGDPDRFDPLKQTSDIITLLSEQQPEVAASTAYPVPVVVLKITIPEEEQPEVRLSPDFTGLLRAHFHANQFQAVFGSLVHRLRVVTRLRKQVAKLRLANTDTHGLQLNDFEAGAVWRSPFLRGARDNCRLVKAVMAAAERTAMQRGADRMPAASRAPGREVPEGHRGHRRIRKALGGGRGGAAAGGRGSDEGAATVCRSSLVACALFSSQRNNYGD
jgi:urease gamma subunit